MKAKAALYFLLLCRQLLYLERYRRKKGKKVKVRSELWAFYGTWLTGLQYLRWLLYCNVQNIMAVKIPLIFMEIRFRKLIFIYNKAEICP